MTLVKMETHAQSKKGSHLVWRYNSRAVWSDQPGFSLSHQGVLDPDHVLLWDPLRYAHDERDLALHGLEDGGRGAGRWDVDHGGVRFHSILGLHARVWEAQLVRSVGKRIRKHS